MPVDPANEATKGMKSTMTELISSGRKITIFKFGKPSISMGHLYHGYVSHNQRVMITQYLGDYNNLRTGNPVLNQPVIHGMTEGF